MKTTEQIMESIQEHASTWSLAGGRFDDGTMFEQAKQQKAALRTAIEELHKDAARLEWAMHCIPGSAWRHVGVNYNAGCTREDIDAAIDAAKEST